MKKYIYISALAIFMSIILAGCGELSNKVKQVDEILEVGEEFDIEQAFNCKKGITIELASENTVDTSKIGSVSANFVISDGDEKAKKSFSFQVTDTQPPVLECDDLTLNLGASFDPNEHIVCTDNSGENVAVSVKENSVDTWKTGNYTVAYEATDSSGNLAEKTVNVQVKTFEDNESVVNFIKPYLRKNGFESFSCKEYVIYDSDSAVGVSGKNFSTLRLDSDRTFVMYPEVYITCFTDGVYKVKSVRLFMELDDRSYYSDRYNLTADKLTASSASGSFSISDEVGLGDSEFERSYYLSKFNYQIEGENIKTLTAMLNDDEITFDITARDISDDVAVPISYKLSGDDLEMLKNAVEIYNYVSGAFGDFDTFNSEY
ncbi:MAG: DUF5011 domain-containing protein [Firmicutes bacterium]|nr:DUF5011 domain-containing protein [Bacillota bacterium]